MANKKTNKKRTSRTKQTYTPLFISGLVMLLLSPLLYYVVAVITQATCPQTEYGGCEMGYALGAAVIAIAAPIVVGVIAIAVLIYAKLNK